MRYILTRQAETDLLEIWRYTAKTWGKAQADSYFAEIETCFEAIASEKVKSRRPFIPQQKLHVVRCKQHYIFFLKEKKPQIVAVLHGKMDILVRLKKRLS